MNNAESLYKESYTLITEEITEMLKRINPAETQALIDMLCSGKRVFFTGVGRVMLSLSAMAKRLSHLNIETHCVGDINEPSMRNGDILVVASGSGESILPVALAKKAKDLNGLVILIGSNPKSTIAGLCDLFVRIPAQTKLALPDEFVSKQAMTSLFEQTLLIYADTVAQMIIAQRELDIRKLWDTHANLE